MISPLTTSDILSTATIGDKINELVEQSNNTERAIEQMSIWLLARSWDHHDHDGIIKILRGETNPEAKR